jgi:hypothetical protein
MDKGERASGIHVSTGLGKNSKIKEQLKEQMKKLREPMPIGFLLL